MMIVETIATSNENNSKKFYFFRLVAYNWKPLERPTKLLSTSKMLEKILQNPIFK